MRVSIVIPTYNEAFWIAKNLNHLRQVHDIFEIIVVDGGSNDETTVIAQKYGVICITSEKGRGIQMNTGASVATGDVIMFLHADTLIPLDAIVQIRTVFEGTQYHGGCFSVAFDYNHWLLRFSSFVSGMRFTFLHFGDAAYFVKKDSFMAIQGYKNPPILEDLEFWQRFNSCFKTKVLPARVLTDARRFVKYGVIKEQLLSVVIVLLYKMKVDYFTLYKIYKWNKK